MTKEEFQWLANRLARLERSVNEANEIIRDTRAYMVCDETLADGRTLHSRIDVSGRQYSWHTGAEEVKA